MASRQTSPAGRTSRRAFATSISRALLSTAAMTWVYFELPLDNRTNVSSGALLVCGLVLFVGLLTWQVRSIMHSHQPRLRAIEALATAVPFFVLLFATTYVLLARSDDQAFSEPLSRLDALYFTLTVLATVGFGDIVARSETARVFVTVQMVGDLIVIGLGVRLLLSAVQVGLSRQTDRAAEPAEAERDHPDRVMP